MIRNRFVKIFLFRHFRHRIVWSEYSISIRSPHIRVFFCVKEIAQKITYSRWCKLTNSHIKYNNGSFGNNLSFVGKNSARILVSWRNAKNNTNTCRKTCFDNRAAYFKIFGEQENTGTCFLPSNSAFSVNYHPTNVPYSNSYSSSTDNISSYSKYW